MRPSLSRVPGVGTVEVLASDTREIEVIVDPAKLAAASLTVGDVADALKAANQLQPVGRYPADGLQHLVLASGMWSSVEDIAATPLVVKGGTTLRVSDVAEVRQGAPDRTSLISGDGRTAANISISQQIGANILDVRAGVEDGARRARALAPIRAASVEDLRPGRVRRDGNRERARRDPDRQPPRRHRPARLPPRLAPDARGVGDPAADGHDDVPGHARRSARRSTSCRWAGWLSPSDSSSTTPSSWSRTSTGISTGGRRPPTRSSSAMQELVAPVVGSTLTTVVVFVPLGLLSGVVGQFFRALSMTLAAAVLISLVQALDADSAARASRGEASRRSPHSGTSGGPARAALRAHPRRDDAAAVAGVLAAVVLADRRRRALHADWDRLPAGSRRRRLRHRLLVAARQRD